MLGMHLLLSVLSAIEPTGLRACEWVRAQADPWNGPKPCAYFLAKLANGTMLVLKVKG